MGPDPRDRIPFHSCHQLHRLPYHPPGSGCNCGDQFLGQVVETVDISRDGTYEIPNALGGSNTITVKDGQVSCTEASCPDKICIHQGHISHNGEMIVCLPNQMIAKVVGNDK